MNIPRFSKPVFILGSILIFGFAFALLHWETLTRYKTDSDWSLPLPPSSPDSTPFQSALARGDKYFTARDYLNAKASYQVAINLSPADSLAKSKLRKTMDLLRSQKAQNILYDVTVASADKLFQEKDYERARQEYENAGKLMPAETYPKQRINEIIKIQVDKQVSEEKYSRAILNGDGFYNVSDFRAALPEYQIATKLKPDEKYPSERVAELTVIVRELKAKDDAYSKAISQADLQFKGAQYTAAKKAYTEALAVKPEQAYPSNRIREIEDILAREKKTRENYEQYIAIGDSLYIGRNYLKARENYKLALSVKPKEAYPREMIQKAENLLTGQEAAQARALDDQYVSAIANGDKLLAGKSYEQSRAEFLKASGLKPLEQYPKDKIEEIGKMFRDQKTVEDTYKLSIANADKLFAQKSYEPAKTAYIQASGYKPDENYPRDQVSRIDAILYEIEAVKTRGEQYKVLIASADKLLLEKSYEQARSSYQKALDLNSKEFYPKSKMAEIDRILLTETQQKASEEKYLSILANADSLLTLKSYEPARTEYQNALKIKPAETYPKGKLAEIATILELFARQKALEDQYNAMIAKADDLLAKKQYQLSRTSYEQSLKLKAGEPYPSQKILELDKILTDLTKVKELDEQYQAILANADKLLLAKSFELARVEYVNAGNLKPEAQYPKDRIAGIDKILGEILAKKTLDEQYSQVILNADKLLAGKTYDQARLTYQNALELKSSEAYPKTKIAEIDLALASIAKQLALDTQYSQAITKADKLLEEKSYVQAKLQFQEALKTKPGEEYPQSRIKEIDIALGDLLKQKALDDQYAAAIMNADKLFSDKSYEPAKLAYIEAGKIKPNEQFPRDKVTEIEKILAEIAEQKALDDQYQTFITNADKFLLSKSYEQARVEYVNAGNLKPEAQYPKEKISAIDRVIGEIAAKKELDEQYLQAILKADKLLSGRTYEQARAEYQTALNLKPTEAYPKTKIEEIGQILSTIAKQQALDARYSLAITSADKLLEEKSFEQSKLQYQSALFEKPAAEYPQSKIREIDIILGDIAKKQALDDQYTAAITGADKLFEEKSYEPAKKAYTDAGRIKPLEQYTRDRIAEIDKLLAALSAQKTLNERYQAIIAKADQSMTSKLYDQAKLDYSSAGKLKPDEQYPKDRISEIERILAENKAREDAYRTAVTKADGLLLAKKYEEARLEYQNASSIKPESTYPAQKITEINKALETLLGKRKLFENFLAGGESLLNESEYNKAKESFKQASSLFPEEKAPGERIAYINAKVDSIYRANKGKYDKVVGDGDRFFNAYEYDKAIDAFNEAIAYLPMENYPREMIVKIRKIIAENAIVDVFKSTAVIKAEEEKQFQFTPVSPASRKNNFIYIKLKNLSNKSFNVLMRYGNDKQRGGGVVIRNLSADGKVNERLISVMDQDTWYRLDNNWISLYPQGGDIEVTFIQISRSR